MTPPISRARSRIGRKITESAKDTSALTDGLEHRTDAIRANLARLLAEPEVKLLMMADGVNEHELLAMLSAVSAKLLERSGQLADGQDQYRPGVGIVLLNDEGQVFVGHRNASSQNPWQLPQGGIQKGESAHEAALRELMEELGTNNVEVIAESNGWFSYDVPEANAVEAWSGRWKGQRQKWFVMAFKGRNEDFDLTCGDAEFKVWRWVSIHDLPMLAVPFKRALYQDIVKEFAAIVSGRTT